MIVPLPHLLAKAQAGGYALGYFEAWDSYSLEAVIGALYLDQGYEAAKIFITENLLVTFKQILDTGSWMDPKSRLQEIAQSRDGFTPVLKTALT